jgi:hypothetical protein
LANDCDGERRSRHKLCSWSRLMIFPRFVSPALFYRDDTSGAEWSAHSLYYTRHPRDVNYRNYIIETVRVEPDRPLPAGPYCERIMTSWKIANEIKINDGVRRPKATIIIIAKQTKLVVRVAIRNPPLQGGMSCISDAAGPVRPLFPF